MAELRQRIEAFIQRHKEADVTDCVLFDDALVQLVRISRILHTPGAHALLVGEPGLGKRSLAHLASFIAACRTFHLSLSRYAACFHALLSPACRK